MSQVVIGCKLPNGIIFHGPSGEEIEINGLNRSPIAGEIGITRVDASVWAYVEFTYAEHCAFKNQTVFTYNDSNNVADVVAVAEELSELKTGFEGVDPAQPGKDVKPDESTAKQLEQQLAQGAHAVPPKPVKGGKPSRAAAAELAAVVQGV